MTIHVVITVFNAGSSYLAPANNYVCFVLSKCTQFQIDAISNRHDLK